MFMKVRSKLFSWLAPLALCPVVGWGQPRIITHPQNKTVCVGESAEFTSETKGGTIVWNFNGMLPLVFFSEHASALDMGSAITSNGTTVGTITITYNQAFNGLKVQSTVEDFDSPFDSPIVNSTTAYLFYKTNQQHPATGLNATANGTAIQADWEASEVRTQYLVSVSNVTETPAVVSSPHYVYFPESQDCRWYELMVTAHECVNTTDPDISQTIAAPIRVAYPNISPVTVQLNNKTVLVSWPSDGGSAFWIVVTDLESGNQTTYNGTSPFSYIPVVCGLPIKLNVSVSPAQCADDPAFTHSDSISFTIDCPTTASEATEAEVTGQPSGTQAIYPSLLLAVAAIVPLLKWQH